MGVCKQWFCWTGFAFRSRHDLSQVREFLKQAFRFDPDQLTVRDYGPALAKLIHRLRPELDVYLLSERDIEGMAGRVQTAVTSAASSTAPRS